MPIIDPCGYPLFRVDDKAPLFEPELSSLPPIYHTTLRLDIRSAKAASNAGVTDWLDNISDRQTSINEAHTRMFYGNATLSAIDWYDAGASRLAVTEVQLYPGVRYDVTASAEAIAVRCRLRSHVAAFSQVVGSLTELKLRFYRRFWVSDTTLFNSIVSSLYFGITTTEPTTSAHVVSAATSQYEHTGETRYADTDRSTPVDFTVTLTAPQLAAITADTGEYSSDFWVCYYRRITEYAGGWCETNDYQVEGNNLNPRGYPH